MEGADAMDVDDVDLSDSLSAMSIGTGGGKDSGSPKKRKRFSWADEGDVTENLDNDGRVKRARFDSAGLIRSTSASAIPMWSASPFGSLSGALKSLAVWNSAAPMLPTEASEPEPLPEGTIELEVKTLSGRRVTVRTLLKDSVFDLKSLVFEQTSIPTHEMRLIYKGRHLADERSVESYGLGNKSVIHLVFAMKGGS